MSDCIWRHPPETVRMCLLTEIADVWIRSVVSLSVNGAEILRDADASDYSTRFHGD